MAERTMEFKESHAPAGREDVMRRRIGDLQLKLAGTRLERLVARLQEELERAGLSFRPPVYLSDEWGCPDRVPIIGVPFYLADPDLTRIEEEQMGGVEAESDDAIMRYLRHEAGHAFNYAYRLLETPEWTEVFGPFARPYPEEYTPKPFSRSFVRHLPAWYAQKHPDEDFAETFAVWLDPDSKWREVYAGWPCFKKLDYLDDLARRIGREPPPVTAENYDTTEPFLAQTIEEHYKMMRARPIEIPPAFDTALRDIFDVKKEDGAPREPAGKLFRRHKRAIVSAVFYWTGLDDSIVRSLVNHLEERVDRLGLTVAGDDPSRLTAIVAFVTALCMNRLNTGEFLGK